MSNYYVFSNGEKLYCLAKNKDVDGLKEEIKNTVVQKRANFFGISTGTQTVFEFIFNALVKKKEYEALKEISTHIQDACAASWDVETLLVIKSKQSTCGVLTATAAKVIAEYEQYKSIAYQLFQQRCPEPEWTVEYDETVTFVFDKGRLAFIKDSTEHVIFYGEDKYLTLTYNQDRKTVLNRYKRVYP